MDHLLIILQPFHLRWVLDFIKVKGNRVIRQSN